jgi:16S rRNA (uracil1498-N3)-methyltransferase
VSNLQRLAIAQSQINEGKIALAPQQYHYLSRVLRLQTGDRLIAIDGSGNSWLIELEGTSARIIESVAISTELTVEVTLMLALPKGNGFDEVVRSCAELGVSCIMPLLSDRTLLDPSPQKLERWRRIATEAAEQSERQFVPVILDPVPFTVAIEGEGERGKGKGERGKSELLTLHSTLHTSYNTQHSTLNTPHFLYICVARGEYPHLLDCLLSKPPLADGAGQKKIAIAIGPEGGWTQREIENAIAAGFQPVSLGSRILRAITAPIAAMSIVSAAIDRQERFIEL